MDTIYEAADIKPKLTYEDITRELEEGQVVDMDMAQEIMMIGDNDGDLYNQQYLPIIKNLMRKRAKGVYDHNLAIKLWRYLIDNVAKNDAGHMARHKWSGIVRNMAAKDLADEELDNMENGEYNHIDLKRGAE